MKRHGGTYSAYYLVKEANLRRLHTVIPVCHSGKSKTIEAINRSVIAIGGRSCKMYD